MPASSRLGRQPALERAVLRDLLLPELRHLAGPVIRRARRLLEFEVDDLAMALLAGAALIGGFGEGGREALISPHTPGEAQRRGGLLQGPPGLRLCPCR